MPMQIDPKSQPPTAQKAGSPSVLPARMPQGAWTAEQTPSDKDNAPPPSAEDEQRALDKRIRDYWEDRGRSTYQSSTSYVDSNYRKAWEDGIRAFNNQHSADSKYSQPAYDKRSKLFRPKTRSVIRKNEAAAAAAFFSNMDVVSVQAEDQSNQAQIASAEVMKRLLQYRLGKSVPWFQTVLGGVQDAQTVGVVCSHNYWDYRARVDEEGQEMPAHIDKPCIDLVPIENFRVDPGANWINPVESSPYIIHLMPLRAQEVYARIASGEWLDIPKADIDTNAASGDMDSTRLVRNTGREDPLSSDGRRLRDYDVVWVHRHIHRVGEDDWEFYMLGDVRLLSMPRPLKETVLHGRRPYTLGCWILETHKALPSGVPQISKGLQDEANEIANQRIDNVKFALNKKWFAKRGKQVDLGGLVRNVPGGIVMMDDPEKDVREITWPDVTQSSYEEQNRINTDMDELLGNFNPAGLMSQSAGAAQAPARNMAMLSQATGTLVEYGIRTAVETWIEPTLRQLVLLEQHYETDRVILALAAQRAQLFQKFGIDEVTDELLNQELTLTVNVGMGATDPFQKLQKFLAGITAYSNIVQKPTPGMNTVEVGREIFAHLGYQDGSRFFTVDNPQVVQLQQLLQQAGAKINELEGKLKEKTTQHLVGLKKTEDTNRTKVQTTIIHEENENRRNLATHWRGLMGDHIKAQVKPAKTGGRKAKSS